MAASAPHELVRRETQVGVTVLTIDNPPVNVLSAAVLDRLTARLEEVERDPTCRVVVLAGAAEKAFAAGANIREMAPMGPPEAFGHGSRGQGVTTRIEALPLPVIAAVHGSCLGGGCEIAMACDFIVASDDAVFGQPEINLGVMPGWGGTQRLPVLIGPQRARAWIYLGQPVAAREAHEQGLVHQVVPRGELMTAARTLATALTQKSALALAAAKYAIHRASHPTLTEGLSFELTLWSRLFGTPDQREGMAAFLAKGRWAPSDRSQWERDSAPFPWAPTARSNPPAPRTEAKGKN